MVNIGQPKAFNPNFDTPSLNTVANTIQNATQTYHCAASGRSYNISMIWAARSSVSVSQQRANIQWNGITIGSLVPTDYNLRYFQTTVLAIVGSNQLNIVSLPFSATDGVIVSSVSVI